MNGSSSSNAAWRVTVLHRMDVATITREAASLHPDHVGLTLRDSKTVLSGIQRTAVTDQVDVEAAAW